MDKKSKEYIRFKAEASSLIANLLYSSWRDYNIEKNVESDPNAFFESEYAMCIHPTKSEWYDLVYKFFCFNVAGRGIWAKDIDLEVYGTMAQSSKSLGG